METHTRALEREVRKIKIEEFVEGLEEDELRRLAKVRASRDWKNHVETLGPLYWVRTHYGEEIGKLMLELQKQAQKELEKLRRHVIHIDIEIMAMRAQTTTE